MAFQRMSKSVRIVATGHDLKVQHSHSELFVVAHATCCGSVRKGNVED